MDEDFRFVRIMRDVDDVLQREVIKPRCLQIAVSRARQTFPPVDAGAPATSLLVFAGTVVFGDNERDELAEVEETETILGRHTDRTTAVRLRDPNAPRGPQRIAGSGACVAQASLNNTRGEDSFGIKVECAAVRVNGDDAYLLANVGANHEGELARMGYQATILEGAP
jgi:hypothetical protein